MKWLRGVGRDLCRSLRVLDGLPGGGYARAFRLRASYWIDPRGARDLVSIPVRGIPCVVDASEDVGRYLLYGLDFEPLMVALVAAYLTPGDVVFDIGANFGLYSVVSQRALAGSVYAFEPNPRALDLLRRNVAALEDAGNVHIEPSAVGKDSGTVRFQCAIDSAFSSIVETGRLEMVEQIEVPIVSLDEFIRNRNLGRVDVVKIDVEGYEPEVLEGGVALFSRVEAPVIFLEIAQANLEPRGLSQMAVIAQLRRLGYVVRVAIPGLAEPEAVTTLRQHENFVAVKPPMLPRLLEAARIAV